MNIFTAAALAKLSPVEKIRLKDCQTKDIVHLPCEGLRAYFIEKSGASIICYLLIKNSYTGNGRHWPNKLYSSRTYGENSNMIVLKIKHHSDESKGIPL